MADEQAAYTDSSRRSEQLSCTKFFHPSYGLFYMIFQSFKQFLNFFEFIYHFKLKVKLLSVPTACTQQCTKGADRWGPVDFPVNSQLGPLTGQRGLVGPSCQ